MATLKKNGIEVPPAMLARVTGSGGGSGSGGVSGSGGNNDEPLSEKEIEEMTSKISKATGKSSVLGNKFSAPHSGLDPTQYYQNNDKVLYYTVNAHKLENELKKSFAKIEDIQKEKESMQTKNNELQKLLREMMDELQRLQKYLTITRSVRDKGVSVDTFMDDFAVPVIEQEPYEIKINIQRNENDSTSQTAPEFNHHMKQNLKSI